MNMSYNLSFRSAKYGKRRKTVRIILSLEKSFDAKPKSQKLRVQFVYAYSILAKVFLDISSRSKKLRIVANSE